MADQDLIEACIDHLGWDLVHDPKTPPRNWYYPKGASFRMYPNNLSDMDICYLAACLRAKQSGHDPRSHALNEIEELMSAVENKP